MCRTARGYQLKQICCSFIKHYRSQCSNTRFSKSQDINACSKEACSPAVVTMVKRGQLWTVLLHRRRGPSYVGWEGVIVDVERNKLRSLYWSKTAFCFKADYWAHAVGKVTMLQAGRPDSGSGASRLLVGGVKLTATSRRRLRMSGAIHLLLLCTLVAWQGQFYFTSQKHQPQMWTAELLRLLQPGGFIDCRFNAWKFHVLPTQLYLYILCGSEKKAAVIYLISIN